MAPKSAGGPKAMRAKVATLVSTSEIEKYFMPGDVNTVTEILDQYHGSESLRVKRAILDLAVGDLSKLRHYVRVANKDYRDVLYRSEYPE